MAITSGEKSWEYSTDGELVAEQLEREKKDRFQSLVFSPATLIEQEKRLLQERNRPHPFWHLCRKGAMWFRVIVASLAIDAFYDFATFKPTHSFYQWIGWIK